MGRVQSDRTARPLTQFFQIMLGKQAETRGMTHYQLVHRSRGALALAALLAALLACLMQAGPALV